MIVILFQNKHSQIKFVKFRIMKLTCLVLLIAIIGMTQVSASCYSRCYYDCCDYYVIKKFVYFPLNLLILRVNVSTVVTQIIVLIQTALIAL